MYLNIGGDRILKKSDIIGIFDIDNTSISKRTREFLSDSQKAGQIINAADDIPKAFLITNDGGKTKVYLSQLMTATLAKRHKTKEFL